MGGEDSSPHHPIIDISPPVYLTAFLMICLPVVAVYDPAEMLVTPSPILAIPFMNQMFVSLVSAFLQRISAMPSPSKSPSILDTRATNVASAPTVVPTLFLAVAR